MIVGAYHYALTLVKLKVTDKKLSDVLSEMDTLHRNYKDEIADIKKRNKSEIAKAIEFAIDTYDKKMDKFLENNKSTKHGWASLASLYYGDKKIK